MDAGAARCGGRGIPMLKDRKKGQRSKFSTGGTGGSIFFWRKFGGIAPIPTAPVEGQRSRDKIKVKCQVVPPGG